MKDKYLLGEKSFRRADAKKARGQINTMQEDRTEEGGNSISFQLTGVKKSPTDGRGCRSRDFHDAPSVRDIKSRCLENKCTLVVVWGSARHNACEVASLLQSRGSFLCKNSVSQTSHFRRVILIFASVRPNHRAIYADADRCPRSQPARPGFRR